MGSITQGTPVNQPPAAGGGSILMGTPRYADSMARNPTSPHQGNYSCCANAIVRIKNVLVLLIRPRLFVLLEHLGMGITAQTSYFRKFAK